MDRPTIECARLVLRPFAVRDARDVRKLAGDFAIADTTLNIPHPYEDGMAEEWIATHGPEWKAGKVVTFAVVLRDSSRLIGAIGLTLDREFSKAEMGYWIGQRYWNKGYATEAAVAVLDFGFGQLGLNRIAAKHLARNPASGRVMQKAGMRQEGTARQTTMKWGKYEDLVHYAVLRDDWAAGRTA